MRAEDVDKLQEPMCPEPDVRLSFNLPSPNPLTVLPVILPLFQLHVTSPPTTHCHPQCGASLQLSFDGSHFRSDIWVAVFVFLLRSTRSLLQVHILLPPLPKLRTVVDRLKSLSEVIAIRANGNGKLQISVSTDDIKTDVDWSGLTNPPMAKDASNSQEPDPTPEPRNLDQMYGVLMNIRSFIKFLSASSVSGATIACICQNHAMILYVYIGDVSDAGGVLTFYIPAIIDDGP
ncbi:hypothetical protein EIP91_010222 [Steccherinum ochraceum]|uniref:Checkpoint protein n=1 Tax=Steccherinum ochraceum TaxID=92696 RepID=A0A4V2MUY4_9APHY|nr:hypothetical protein EIP91_010222 [Steccherinum ochraceum]